jgi:peroxiredoxin
MGTVRSAPDFTLPDIHSGKSITLSDYRGKVVLLTFWVSWCPDCLQDFPRKEQLYRSANHDDLSMFMINVSGREVKPEDGQAFLKEQEYTFPALIDDGTSVYDAYQCRGVPTTVLIDREQHIAVQYGDQYTFADMIRKLGTLLT